MAERSNDVVTYPSIGQIVKAMGIACLRLYPTGKEC